MEDTPQFQSSEPVQPVCANCKIEPSLPGYPTPLCATCRNSFIKYPIPKWIYAFGAGILVVMIIALVRVPPYLSVAINLGKAQNAINARKYKTAEKALDKVLAKVPDNTEAQLY